MKYISRKKDKRNYLLGERQKILEQLISNIGTMDSQAQNQLLKHLLENENLAPEQREKLLKDLVQNIGNLDKWDLLKLFNKFFFNFNSLF